LTGLTAAWLNLAAWGAAAADPEDRPKAHSLLLRDLWSGYIILAVSDRRIYKMNTGRASSIAGGAVAIAVLTLLGCPSWFEKPVTGVSLNKSSATTYVGGTEQLVATIEPADATVQDVTWSSSEATTASVSSEGLVTGVAEGPATITVTTVDGAKTATCPVTVTPARVRSVSTGELHTMILRTDGSLWTTGWNLNGQLGDGTTADKSVPVHVMPGVQSASGGTYHTMIVKTDGSLWATGYNFSGQLVDETQVDKISPVQVMTGAQSVSAGSNYTMIVKTDGTLWGAGDNEFGQIGNGESGTGFVVITPIQVMTGVRSVSAGQEHTMIVKTDGTLWATGSNYYGQFGNGEAGGAYEYNPTPVQAMTGVQAVSAGQAHTMILKNDGSLWATGNNASGQLGDGTTVAKSSPVQVMTGVQAVSAGSSHTMILKTDGTLWATGNNLYGGLGDGTTTAKSTPVQVLSGVQSVSAGQYYTMAVKTDNTLWATGRNSRGQFGDGTTTDRSSFVQTTLP
jgi:alpha-tubulin suppressor-like RCC1 family protein